MQQLSNQTYTGERALFFGQDLAIDHCVFEEGESPLKESRHICLSNSVFRWKYPLWYAHDIDLRRCRLEETARSGIWYTRDIRILDSMIEAPKTFRRASDIHLDNVQMPHAQETLWNCEGVHLDHVRAAGDYFGMGSNHVRARDLRLDGNYCFDGGSDIRIENSVLNSKDSFWNTRNVEVRGSTIIGEYLGWNSQNLTLVDCTIESLQGMCYINNLRLVNCTLVNTTLAFEYCTVDADIAGGVDSVLNPTAGIIRAGHIGQLILQPDRVDPTKTTIIIKD